MKRDTLFFAFLFVTFIVPMSLYAADPVLSWPIKNAVVTQRFSYNPADSRTERGTVKGHPAIDLTAGFGAPVVAAARGVVLGKSTGSCPNFSKSDCNDGGGNWIILSHPELNLHTIYLHLQHPSSLHVGTIVYVGDVIGYEGGSGKQINVATKEPVTVCCEGHLHFGVVRKIMVYINFEGKSDYSIGEMVNPLDLLPPRQSVN